MKITIELTEAQVKGLKEYLEETGPSVRTKPVNKAEIQQEIRGHVDGCLQSGAIADYIAKYEQNG